MMLASKAKRLRKPKEGDVLAVPLGSGKYAFGQVCKAGGSYAYFDVQSESFPPVREITAHPVIFRVPMAGDAAQKGGWQVIGNAPLTEALAEDACYRNQPVGSNQLYLVKGSEVIPAKYDDVKDLELMAWWSEHHVVERLVDHFANRPNPMTERFKVIKLYDVGTGAELDPLTGKEVQPKSRD